MFLIKPTNSHLKWNIRFTNFDGKVVKIPGDRDRLTALRTGERVMMLLRAKQSGDPSPSELKSWIDNMPPKLADRLISLGLLSNSRRNRSKPLNELIIEYGRTVAARKSNRPRHALQQERKIRQACAAMKVRSVDDLNLAAFQKYLSDRKIATSTRRSYIITMKDFAKELIALGVLSENPFARFEAPGAYENPEYERQPMTVEQFRKLMDYLDTFERYKHQNARWTAYDRKLIYWTAVKTAYRQSELKALVKGNLHLDTKPAVVSLKARFTKNKTEGEVPIPTDLADALRKYVADLEPTDKVFKFPHTSGSIVDMLRRDLNGAGIEWKLPTGEVIDFHALRSTAISWWLDVEKLSPKRVQVLSRLKTLALVYNYSRNLRIDDFSWLESGPLLVDGSIKVMQGASSA
jgi:site-specific recombinase XerD